jgi:(1->4)-alpha-D-glucan 1-alpha-D-glucosylmutase
VIAEGRRSALSQLLLKLTAPGVPDVYQGDELESLSLVDPDNRRPVDWEARRAALARIEAGEGPWDFGSAKLALIRRALALRERRPEPFAGAYSPVEAGPGVCAYVRGDEVLVVVPVRSWEGAALGAGAAGRWRDVLAGDDATLELGAGAPVAPLVAAHGVALLERA